MHYFHHVAPRPDGTLMAPSQAEIWWAGHFKIQGILAELLTPRNIYIYILYVIVSYIITFYCMCGNLTTKAQVQHWAVFEPCELHLCTWGFYGMGWAEVPWSMRWAFVQQTHGLQTGLAFVWKDVTKLSRSWHRCWWQMHLWVLVVQLPPWSCSTCGCFEQIAKKRVRALEPNC